jgi:hypothetical protein
MYLSPGQVFWLARILTYHLNACVDAQIAASLMRFVRSGVLPNDAGEVPARARGFVRAVRETAGGATDERQQLSAVAFTLERVNGLADHLYARVLANRLFGSCAGMVGDFVRLHGAPVAVGRSPYPTGRATVGGVLAIAGRVLFDRRSDLDAFGSRNGITITLPTSRIARVICLVQRMNIASNRRTARRLKAGDPSGSARVAALLHAAKATNHPEAFARGAMATERAASRWDELISSVLRARFGLR